MFLFTTSVCLDAALVLLHCNSSRVKDVVTRLESALEEGRCLNDATWPLGMAIALETLSKAVLDQGCQPIITAVCPAELSEYHSSAISAHFLALKNVFLVSADFPLKLKTELTFLCLLEHSAATVGEPRCSI